jgi:hypothetical protein
LSCTIRGQRDTRFISCTFYRGANFHTILLEKP